jgi:hypothetical protein
MAKNNDDDYLAAHHEWLQNFIDNGITLSPRMCDASKAPVVRKLVSITEAIRPSK